MNQVGMMLVFKEGVTRKEVEDLCDRLKKEEKVEMSGIITFDPKFGYPVFYVP